MDGSLREQSSGARYRYRSRNRNRSRRVVESSMGFGNDGIVRRVGEGMNGRLDGPSGFWLLDSEYCATPTGGGQTQ